MNKEKIFTENSCWSVLGMRRAGSYHEQRNEECQDFIADVQTRYATAIALADGAGSCERAQDGARIAASITAEFLAKRAHELELLDDDDIQYHVLMCVRRAMNDYCKKNRLLSLKSLGSTLVAAVATRNGIILVHLGDGWIMKTNEEQKLTFLSLPENGIRRNQTYLTSMLPVMEHVRIKRVPLHDVDAVTLFSDGWETEAARYDIDEIETALKTGEAEAHWDDISVIRMQKKKV